MLAAAERAGVTHSSATSSAGRPTARVAARAIADGLIGEPRHGDARAVRAARRRSRPRGCREWWFDAARGGGWLGASGSHIVDQVRTWFGEVASVERDAADGGARATAPRTRSSVRVTMRSRASKVVLQQTAASWTPGVVGPDGRRGHRRHARGRRRRRVAARIATAGALLDVPDDLALPGAAGASDDPRHRYTHLELGPYTRLCEALRAGVEGRDRRLASAFRCRRSPTASRACSVLDAIRASAGGGGAAQVVGVGAVAGLPGSVTSGAVVLAVGVLGERLAARRPSGSGGMAERHDRDRHNVVGKREESPQLAAKAGGDRRERAPEPERGRREQQVLHRREDRRRDRRLEPALGVGAHDDVHRRGRDAAGRAAVDVGEQLRREPRLRERAAVRFPRPAGEVADRARVRRRRARRRTPTAGGSRRSARSVAASSSARCSSSVTGVVAELAARALAARRRRRSRRRSRASARRRARTSSRT